MTRPNPRKHGDPCEGYASRRDQRPPRSRSSGLRERPRSVSERGGVPGRTARRRTPQRQPAAREPRTQPAGSGERRTHPALGPRDRSTVVIDAWPVMRAYAGEEPARSAMRDLLRDDSRTAIMSTTNFSEAIGALLQQYGPEAADRQERALRQLVEIEPPSADVAVCASRVGAGWYLSQADAMAVATALRHDAPIWTGDPELLTGDRCWLAVDLRDSERRARQEQRRSAGALIGRKRRPSDRLASLTDDEIAAYVTEPLRHPIELRPPAPELDLL